MIVAENCAPNAIECDFLFIENVTYFSKGWGKSVLNIFLKYRWRVLMLIDSERAMRRRLAVTRNVSYRAGRLDSMNDSQIDWLVIRRSLLYV
ncbi:hypothetical protein [Burkholderia ubonensis]|uniref:hypothetical protein n=1 Tax=Burkholderia ubonensis TaxID=101571 RepID=UPI0012F737EC|nr:hypothetical protein [Burkholderia ubonensis]